MKNVLYLILQLMRSNAGIVLWFILSMCTLAHASELSLHVNSTSELRSVLTSLRGGETIVLNASDQPYQIVINGGMKFSAPVTFKTASTHSKVHINAVSLSNVQNMVFQGLQFSSEGPNPQAKVATNVILISQSSYISFVNCTMTGTAQKYVPASAIFEKSNDLMLVRSSDHITVQGNTISSYFHGLQFLETTNLNIVDNDISNIQGDGIRMGGIAHVVIENNKLHDFLGSDQTVNHSDMIQLWSTNARIISSDIRIAGNRLLSGSGVATQSIFMRNELADGDPVGDEKFYKNIIITNNLIQNGHLHGIAVGETKGLEISRNTIIANPQSTMGTGADRVSMIPGIQVAKRSTDVTIINNITGPINAGVEARPEGNLIIRYGAPSERQNITQLFYGAENGGALPLSAFAPLPDSLADNSALGVTFVSDQVLQEFVFHVEDSKMEAGGKKFQAKQLHGQNPILELSSRSIKWDFGDGTTDEGLTVIHNFKEPKLYKVVMSVDVPNSAPQTYWSYIKINEPILFKLGSENGVVFDASPYQSRLTSKVNANQIEKSSFGPTLNLDPSSFVEIRRDNSQIFGLQRFGLSLFLKCAFPCANGVIAGIFKSFSLHITDRQELQFNVTEQSGLQLTLRSGRYRIADGDWHLIIINFDSKVKRAELIVDGKMLSSAEVNESTQPVKSWGLTLGSNFGSSITGSIAAVELSQIPLTSLQIENLTKQLNQ